MGALLPLLCAETSIDRYVEAEMALNGIPGLSLAVVRNGELAYLRAYGLRSVSSREAMRVDTPLELASVSKSLTALAILRLEREQRVDLDAAVARYLVGLRGADWTGVTIRDLLRHRSGLRPRHDSLILRGGLVAPGDHGRAIAILGGARLDSPPGQAFAYANANYLLLAAVAGQASGNSFREFMRDRVFLPFGMHRATVDDAEAGRWNASDLHEQQWGRVLASPSQARGWLGAALVKASAADMGAYLAALLRMDSMNARFGAPSRNWWESLAPDYDLGWFLEPEAAWLGGEFVLQHTGSIWGANTATVLAPRRRAGVAVLANLGTARAGAIARAILRSLDGSPLPLPERADVMDVPDNAAMGMLAWIVVQLVALFAHGVSVVRDLRRGLRDWRGRAWKSPRALAGIALALGLAAVATAGSGPPLAAFPTTVMLVFPPFIASVVVLFLYVAVLALVPRRVRGRGNRPSLGHPDRSASSE